AGSHTGSLAGRDETYRAAFRAAGIVTVDDTEEFFDALTALAAAGDRLPRDPRLAILTISGGPSVVAAAAAEARWPPRPPPPRPAPAPPPAFPPGLRGRWHPRRHAAPDRPARLRPRRLPRPRRARGRGGAGHRRRPRPPGVRRRRRAGPRAHRQAGGGVHRRHAGDRPAAPGREDPHL